MEISLTPEEVVTALMHNKRIKYRHLESGKWISLEGIEIINILLDEEVEFALDHDLITLGDKKYPKPYVGQMKYKQIYYTAALSFNDSFVKRTWFDSLSDKFYMENGLLHLDKENAILHTAVLLDFCKNNL